MTPNRRDSFVVSAAVTLLLSAVTTALLLCDDFIHRWLGGPNQAELEYLTVLWVINLCFWLSGRRWFVNLCLALFSVFQLIQLRQIDYDEVGRLVPHAPPVRPEAVATTGK